MNRDERADSTSAEAGAAEDDGGRSQAQIASALGIGRYKRHILLCVGPNCCSTSQGQESWSYLKTRLRELIRQGTLPPFDVYRSKVGCLRICAGGPIMVIYPEGIWYRAVSPEVCERILQEHLLRGRVVEDYAFASNPLTADGVPDDD